MSLSTAAPDGVRCFSSVESFRGRRLVDALIRLALVVLVLPTAAIAADTEITMTARQIEAIGIKVQALGTPKPAAGVAYPARVVLPRRAEQVISANVSGVIDQVLVEDHATVVAGQPLLSLNSPGFGELQLRLIEAHGRAQLAEQAVTRERALFGEGIIPERRVQEADAAAATARAGEKTARDALRLAGAGEATIQSILAGKVQDRLQLVAPRNGVVLSVAAKPGQRVAEADPLVTVADLGTLWLDIDLPTAKAALWDPKGRITLAGREAEARPISVSSRVGNGQTVELRAEVTRGTAALRPGEYLQAHVPMRGASEAWYVPMSAVVHDDARTVMFVRTEKGFVARDVVVVGESADGANVSGAFSATDEVALTGTVGLKALWLGAAGAEEE